MACIAIIPARSGSKGLKDKNIKDLCGKPLMAYTIDAAIKSGIFDCVHVSTDSEQYAKIAREYGAEAPFLRAPEYATDTAGSWDVVKYVLREYQKLGQDYDTIALLQPTSPLRTEQDIIGAYQLYCEKNANAVVAMCETDHSPLCSNVLSNDRCLKGFVQEAYRDIPRQQLPIYYRVNGAIYFVRKEYLNISTNMYTNHCYAYVMKREFSVDIDDEMDFEICALTIKRHKVIL